MIHSWCYRTAILVIAIVVAVELMVLAGSPSANAHAPTRLQALAQHSAKCIDQKQALQTDGGLVQQYTCIQVSNEEFDLVDTGDTYHKIVFRHSGKCLDVPGSSQSWGVQLVQWTCHGGDDANQRFKVPSTGSVGAIKPKHSQLCLDVKDASTADSWPIIQWSCHGNPNQQWRVQYATSPRYRVWAYPPGEGTMSTYSKLTCKFHGACSQSSGYGLDWVSATYPSGLDGYFRGYNASLNSGITQPLRGDRGSNHEDGGGCDVLDVEIWDPGVGSYRGTVSYYHTETSSQGTSFSIPLGWSQSYSSTMSYDNNCTSGGYPAWSAYHIHEKSTDHRALNTDSTFNGGTYGDYCQIPPNYPPCLDLKNNGSSNWSRYWDW